MTITKLAIGMCALNAVLNLPLAVLGELGNVSATLAWAVATLAWVAMDRREA